MLNEIERSKLQILLNDAALLEAISKVFNETINERKPILSETDNDVVVGQKYRSYETAREIIKEGFRKLDSYKEERSDRKEIKKER